MSTKIGSHPSFGYQLVANISAAEQLKSNDSGKIFMVDARSAFVINLPKISADIAGWQCKFVIKNAGSQDVTIMAHGLPAAGGTTGDAELVIFKEHAAKEAGAGISTAKDGVKFDTNAIVGDYMELFTNGTNWFVNSFVEEANHTSTVDTD